ncbi:MAG: peptidyl-prolyl cis-trans isomerase [Oligoflexia bacterium]|nr:peptidyl-prolyl cis-trans isomerase [Oligoflexia bacterium]
MKKTYLSILSFFLISSITSNAALIDKTVVFVNSNVILLSDINHFKKIYSLRKEVDPFLSFKKDFSLEQKSIANHLIQEELVLQKFPVTDEETDLEISQVQKNNGISKEQLSSVLKSQGISYDSYKEVVKVGIAKRKLIDRELRPLASISDEQVKNFYYTDPRYSSKIKQEKLVLTYSLKQLILPNKKLLQEVQSRLEKNEDFDTVISEVLPKGAETTILESISESNMNSTIRSAIQGLKVGEVTKPISTGSGYLFLKITEIGAPKDPSYEKEKESIRAMLFQKALIEQISLWTDRETQDSFIHWH